MHFAASNGHTDMAELLLRLDAVTRFADGDGYTPLMCAFEGNNKGLPELLID